MEKCNRRKHGAQSSIKLLLNDLKCSFLIRLYAYQGICYFDSFIARAIMIKFRREAIVFRLILQSLLYKLNSNRAKIGRFEIIRRMRSDALY